LCLKSLDSWQNFTIKKSRVTYLSQLVVTRRAGHGEQGFAVIRGSSGVVEVDVALAEQPLHRIDIVIRAGGHEGSREATAAATGNRPSVNIKDLGGSRGQYILLIAGTVGTAHLGQSLLSLVDGVGGVAQDRSLLVGRGLEQGGEIAGALVVGVHKEGTHFGRVLFLVLIVDLLVVRVVVLQHIW